MDLLSLIKEKANYFEGTLDHIGISSVVLHIEVAERHFEGGKAGDDYLFNDVIYRSNQAFEGALKEAYRILKGDDSGNISPYKVEKYFEDNKILKERVLKLFTNYRTEWRNESTHNYKLYFSEQEALLAIVSISAFINILLDQIIEKKSYDRELLNLELSLSSHIMECTHIKLVDRITEMLMSFSSEIPKLQTGAVVPRISESEILGALSAYFSAFGSDITVNQEHKIASDKYNGMGIADFLLENSNEKVIIEVKNLLSRRADALHGGTEQVMKYLLMTGIENGVLYIPPRNINEEMTISDIERSVEGVKYKIYRVCPKKLIEI